MQENWGQLQKSDYKDGGKKWSHSSQLYYFLNLHFKILV